MNLETFNIQHSTLNIQGRPNAQIPMNGRVSVEMRPVQGFIRQRLVFAFILLSLSALFPAAAADTNTSPFTMNGWQLHDYNMPKLEEAVNRAPEYGVNFLIFSHEFFRSVEGFLASTDDANPS